MGFGIWDLGFGIWDFMEAQPQKELSDSGYDITPISDETRDRLAQDLNEEERRILLHEVDPYWVDTTVNCSYGAFAEVTAQLAPVVLADLRRIGVLRVIVEISSKQALITAPVLPR